MAKPDPNARISIVTPSYNHARFIEQTILSVTGQGYPNLDYIVVDGDSVDSTHRILAKYSHKISHCIVERDGGHSYALNKGFAVSSGDIMGWINSDDMMMPWSLKAINEIFAQFPHVNWIQGLPAIWNSEGCLINASVNYINIYDYLLGEYKWIQQESTFWRRSLWEEAGGFISNDVNLMVDGELWTRFFLLTDLYHVSCVLSGWRQYGNNRSSTNYAACEAEMTDLIASLRLKISNANLKNLRKLSPINRISEQLCGGSSYLKLLIDRLLLRGISSKLNMDCGYKCIQWDSKSSSWGEVVLPFR